jgi:hypothetical protein
MKNQNSTSNQTKSKREELSKKLNDIRHTVALPVIGNVTIDVDSIEDLQIVNTNGKLKLRIVYKDNDEYKYALLGTVFVDQVNECIKTAEKIEIVRHTDSLKTEVICR